MMSIKDIINSKKRQNNYIESTNVGGILCPFIKISNYRLFLYGCGRDIDSYLNFFQNNGTVVFKIIDMDSKKNGTLFSGIECVSVDRLNEFDIRSETDLVVITTSCFEGFEQNDIISQIFKMGFEKYYPLNEYDKQVMVGDDWKREWYQGRVRYIQEHVEEFENLFNILEDDLSREVLAEYIRVHIECGIYSLNQIDGQLKYFYGQVDGEKECIYSHLKDEVWLNCGAGIGDNIFLYYANGLSSKKIYAVEGDKTCFRRLEHNIKMLPNELNECILPINVLIDNSTDFSSFIDEKITLINADLEGFEMELLHSLCALIKRDRPVLALSVYHRKDDLITIPNYILQIVSDYSLVLRKYAAANIGDCRQVTELVMYFIPKERLLIDTNHANEIIQNRL